MRRVWVWLRDYAIIIAVMFVASLVTSGRIKAQQGPRPILTEVFTEFDTKLNPSLPWISEYRAPAIYGEWWRELANCEGLSLPVDSLRNVQYFQVNGQTFIPAHIDEIVYAITYENNQTFVSYPLIWNRALVKHEALHLLLKWSGDKDWWQHDPSRFNSCGIVSQGAPPENE